ncbi:MAG: hypothetical protein ABL901_01100 [Hyphomicrobiaceae bacterium]
MNRARTPKADGYSADAPRAYIFALAEPDFTPIEAPTRQRYEIGEDGRGWLQTTTRLRSKP